MSAKLLRSDLGPSLAARPGAMGAGVLAHSKSLKHRLGVFVMKRKTSRRIIPVEWKQTRQPGLSEDWWH